MTARLTVGLLYGGCSAEHNISIKSATAIYENLDQARFSVMPIWISHAGEWFHAAPELPEQDKFLQPRVTLLPQPNGGQLFDATNLQVLAKLDLVFPMVHGTNGEDGTLQGLLELAKIPYVGSGVMAMAICMDKVTSKRIFRDAGLPVVPFVAVTQSQWEAHAVNVIAACEKKLNYPWFIKPVNLGSSIGIVKVNGPAEVADAIEQAFSYDDHVIIEQGVEHSRDIEVSVMGNSAVQASGPGEIISPGEFYDFDAKYVSAETQLKVPADLPAFLSKKMAHLAVQAFEATGCTGYARVDFLLCDTDQEVFVSEINTIPGFTSISLFPRLWAEQGISFTELCTQLIDLALEESQRQQQKQTSLNISD
ncbi:MAG: D-alanine--D-alanine ligase [marine bacterium B5-7]|nr:MAG: D-alanine--D-alanine ligase [marine bacterium B5-7]